MNNSGGSQKRVLNAISGSKIDTRTVLAEMKSCPPLILLAEDNEANVQTFSYYLRAKGYRLMVAQNGEIAIAQARASHPDLILMDVQMPKMDGLEAMRQIRSDPTIASIPMIAITALAMPSDEARCLAAGADEYLSKPVCLKQLHQSIQQHLAHSAPSVVS